MKTLYFSIILSFIFNFVYSQIGWKEYNADEVLTEPSLNIDTNNIDVNRNFVEIQFIGDYGWIASEENFLIHTEDGGEVWNEQIIPSLSYWYGINAIHFISSNEGWVASGKYVHHTTNAGETWEIQLDNTGGHYYNDVYFIDANKGWLCVFDSDNQGYLDTAKLYYTNNGGIDWEIAYRTARVDMGGLQKVYFANSSNGWIIQQNTPYFSDGSAILFSNNLGFNWTSQYTSSDMLYDFFFIGASNGWAVGENGKVLKTEDGGANWELIETPTTRDLRGVHFVDISNGWVVGEYGTILHTHDGGNSWSEQKLESYNDWYDDVDIFDVHFTNSTTGYIVTQYLKIFKTSNGGVSSIDFKIKDNFTRIYPNPIEDKIIVDYHENTKGQIHIFNSLGQSILNEAISDRKEIDMSSYNRGIYFVEIKDDKGNVLSSEKMVKE